MSAAIVLTLIGLTLILLGKARASSLERYEFNNTNEHGVVGFASHRRFKAHQRAKVTAWKVQRLGGSFWLLAALVFVLSKVTKM